MTSQVIFKVDQKIKREAMRKSKKDGVALSYILKLAMKDYVSGNLKLSLTQQDAYGDMEAFRQAGYNDVLKILGPMSKEEYDYYNNL